jgi:hypothetical protein
MPAVRSDRMDLGWGLLARSDSARCKSRFETVYSTLLTKSRWPLHPTSLPIQAKAAVNGPLVRATDFGTHLSLKGEAKEISGIGNEQRHLGAFSPLLSPSGVQHVAGKKSANGILEINEPLIQLEKMVPPTRFELVTP